MTFSSRAERLTASRTMGSLLWEGDRCDHHSAAGIIGPTVSNAPSRQRRFTNLILPSPLSPAGEKGKSYSETARSSKGAASERGPNEHALQLSAELDGAPKS